MTEAVAEKKWWHAFGQVREWPAGPGEEPDRVHQLTVAGPSDLPPERVSELTLQRKAWGDYVTSWDHYPSDAEREAATPEEYRDEPDDED